MADQYEELRRLAAEATPGPWLYRGKSCAVYTAPAAGAPYQFGDHVFTFNEDHEPNDADLAFILAANPETVLRLLAELDALREDARDAARMDWIEKLVGLGKLEIARSLLGVGYEFGHWPKGRPTAKVFNGTLREAIDAALHPSKDADSGEVGNG